MDDTGAAMNTDVELWRGPDEGNGDFYADSVFVTKLGGIGINCGGTVIVKTPRGWHEIATALEAQEARIAELEAALNTCLHETSKLTELIARHAAATLENEPPLSALTEPKP